MIAAVIDAGSDVIAPIIVGVTLAFVAIVGRWAFKVWQLMERQLASNGKAEQAGTSNMNLRDALDENTKVTKALAATLEDHIIRDEQFFAKEEIERAKLRAIMEDRGLLVGRVLDVLTEKKKESP